MTSENSGNDDSGNIPRSLFIGDDCSAIPDEITKTWKKRTILFGNPHPGEKFFKLKTKKRKK